MLSINSSSVAGKSKVSIIIVMVLVVNKRLPEVVARQKCYAGAEKRFLFGLTQARDSYQRENRS